MAEKTESKAGENENQETEDKDFNEAWKEIQKILLEKTGDRPYMCVFVKSNLYYASEEDKKKNKLNGRTLYAYVTRPQLKKDGVSKLLIDTTRYAVSVAERKALEPI